MHWRQAGADGLMKEVACSEGNTLNKDAGRCGYVIN
jgi:hypothetical protein